MASAPATWRIALTSLVKQPLARHQRQCRNLDMRIAYVHGYEGVTGPLLLGALLDAGASLTSVEQVWHHLRLPAAELSCVRVPCMDAMATHVTWTAPHASTFLHPHSYATLIGMIEQSEA